jgi:enterochelin esterase-like enzyme
VLEPQSPVVFVLLLLVFAVFIGLAVRLRRWWLQVPVALLAFVPAMVFGVAVVNKYYDYYGHWKDVVADLDDSAPAETVPMADLSTPGGLTTFLSHRARRPESTRSGFLFRTMISGSRSGINRAGLVYLPPQYFQDDYRTSRFPVIELLHGGPGTPADYTRVMQVDTTYRRLVNSKQVGPAVLVMPDSNGGRDVELQCLDTVRGPKDETYLVNDVAAALVPRLRIMPQGPGWGVAGYSEGGYCAANLALRHPTLYGLAGSLSGYYAPLPQSRLPRRVDPFRGNLDLRRANTPSAVIRSMRIRPPRFWIMAGTGSPRDRVEGQAFSTLVRRIQPDVTFVTVKGGKHNFTAWRKVMPTFLMWATRRLPEPEPNR